MVCSAGERSACISSTTRTKEGPYESMKTPGGGTVDVEGGALREGGRPIVFSRDCIGLVIQYAAVGLIYGTLPEVIYPFLQKYLNASGAVTTTAETLVELPWSFKVFYGILSDCVPIRGYRRRPYMILGWAICILMLVTMAATPVGPPYFTNPEYRKFKPIDYTPEIEATLNRSAADKGSKYVILMMFSAFGYLMADVAADGMVCELAQREPLAVRGTLQTIIYTTRTIFTVIASILIAFAFNGKDYGGRFDFSITFPTLMLILAICLAPILPITWLFIKEEKVQAPKFGKYMHEFWKCIKSRVFYQIIFYKFVSGLFEYFIFTASNPTADHWAGVTTLQDRISSILGQVVFAGGLIVTGKYGLNWSWRVMAATTMITVVILDSICTLLTVWNVVRDPWFWLGVPIVERLPKGIPFVVATYVTVELAGDGNEGAVYGLLTTVKNLSNPFARTISKNIDSLWDFSTERIMNDSTEVRRDVTYTVFIMYAAKLFSLVFLFLLPRQKTETQELKRNGGSSKLIGALTIFYLLFALTWVTATNILAIFPSTACLKVAGGSGCK